MTKYETTAADLTSIYGRLDAGEVRMQKIEAELSRNTAVTTEVRDILVTARLGSQFLRLVAGIGTGCVAIWMAMHGTNK